MTNQNFKKKSLLPSTSTVKQGKQYTMTKQELEETFNRFKDRPAIKDALEKGWFIYLRKNGFVVLNPDSLYSTEEMVAKGGRYIKKKHKPKFSETDLKKIEKNYVLYN